MYSRKYDDFANITLADAMTCHLELCGELILVTISYSNDHKNIRT